MPGSRPGSDRLISSQLRRTAPAPSTSTSPKMCGCRRTSFACTCSATALSEPPPRSSSSSERKWTWKSTSPSSSSSLASSPACAAAASSYASPTVCGTIERSSCSRSHGHSRRSRRVNASRRRSASTSREISSKPLLALCGHRRRRRGLRAVLAGGRLEVLGALGLGLPALREVLHERVQRLLLVLGGERLLDLGLGLRERLLAGRRDALDDEVVVAVLGLDRPGERVLLGREHGLVELLVQRALGLRRQLAAVGLRGVVDRVLLGHGLPGLAGLERRAGGGGLGLGLGQHDAQVALLRLGETGLVLVVEVGDRRVGDHVLALDDLLVDLGRQQVALDALHDVVLRLAGGLEELLVVGVLREALLLLLVEGLLDLGVGDLDVLRGRLALDPLEGRQQLQH